MYLIYTIYSSDHVEVAYLSTKQKGDVPVLPFNARKVEYIFFKSQIMHILH